MCRTAALGGRLLECVDCGAHKYLYHSCGRSHCPLCQGNKRRAWYERVEDNLLEVPYCHVTFTLPHELNGLCRLYPRQLYGLLFRVAWRTLRSLCMERFGGLPEMTAVLHTWGSDLKHHPHVHCLVTFGGLDEGRGRWCWPRHKNKLLGHRRLRNTFRANFLRALREWMTGPERPVYHQSYGVLTAGLSTKSWVVNQQPPTVDAGTINAYLSRYICRIGISDRQLTYDATTQRVSINYKDYRRQEPGQAALEATRNLPALVAMTKLLQHVLPAHFHRTRSYGLHAANSRKRLAGRLEKYVKSAPNTVLVLLRLLRQIAQLQLGLTCESCGSAELPRVSSVAPDHRFAASFLSRSGRSPPGQGNSKTYGPHKIAESYA